MGLTRLAAAAAAAPDNAPSDGEEDQQDLMVLAGSAPDNQNRLRSDCRLTIIPPTTVTGIEMFLFWVYHELTWLPTLPALHVPL